MWLAQLMPCWLAAASADGAMHPNFQCNLKNWSLSNCSTIHQLADLHSSLAIHRSIWAHA
jgi:hypothetical protein